MKLKRKINKNETPIEDHKQKGKKLNPPLLDLDITTSSWFDERLPDMLWAALVIGNIKRSKALNYFRYVAKFVKENKECSNVTLAGISHLPREKRELFIEYFSSYSQEVNNILRSLLLFPKLPCFKEWEKVLPKPRPEEDCQKLYKGIDLTFYHQSQEATDCRWIKFLCRILGGKITFSNSIKDIDETIKGVFEYPNYGDLRHIQPFIRASEIWSWGIEQKIKKTSSEWGKYFWGYCFNHTKCIPEGIADEKIQQKQKEFVNEIKNSQKLYFNETTEARKKLINHFLATSQTSAIDSRHESVFGLSLYALSLFIETVLYRTSFSITGRLGLRSLVETYITLSYSLQKEKEEPKIWDDYRSYGTGQTKLIYLKLKKLNQSIGSVDLDMLDLIANEDKWIEFTPIYLGHWDSTNLRKMAEEANLKELYDKFYDYTSGFMHGNWGAVRESVYQRCINPLHRYHKVPTYDLPLMPNTTKDAIEVMNKIFECLSAAYPSFDFRFTEVEINIKKIEKL